MATLHPGRWRLVTKPDPNYPIHIKHVVDTELSAAHACVICTNLQAQEWKVLYPNAYAPQEVTTRIWDPSNPLSPISSQLIPDWPIPGSDPPCLFCGGHTFMSNGKLLMVGGIRFNTQNFPPEPPHLPGAGNQGLDYTYIFDPEFEIWSVAQGPRGPHAMAEKRFYPTLTQLGVVPSNTISGKIVVMSGWKDDLIQVKVPQYYDENEGWKDFLYADVEQPFYGPYDYYPGAHLIPYGLNAGKIFYTIPMKQSYIFNPFWNGAGDPGYWQAFGALRTQYRLNGTSNMLPLPVSL